MDNQHRKISGYRELTQAEIDLMNEIKAMGPQLESLANKVREHIAQQRESTERVECSDAQLAERKRLDAADPEKWADWGKGTMQTGLMYLTRAVAQPTFF